MCGSPQAVNERQAAGISRRGFCGLGYRTAKAGGPGRCTACGISATGAGLRQKRLCTRHSKSAPSYLSRRRWMLDQGTLNLHHRCLSTGFAPARRRPGWSGHSCGRRHRPHRRRKTVTFVVALMPTRSGGCPVAWCDERADVSCLRRAIPSSKLKRGRHHGQSPGNKVADFRRKLT